MSSKMITLECHVSNRPNILLSPYNAVKMSHNLKAFIISHSEQSDERTSNWGIARSRLKYKVASFIASTCSNCVE